MKRGFDALGESTMKGGGDSKTQTGSSLISNSAAIDLQISFFHFCKSFLTTYIEELKHHHDREASIYLIDLLKPIAGLTGVELWKSLPDVAAIAAARGWFALSKEDKAACINDATQLFKASEARSARQEVAKNQDYVRSVYCEEFVKVYSEIYPTDPCLSDITGKCGLQLWYALPDHIALPLEEYLGWNINIYVCAVQLRYPRWRLKTCTSVDERINRSDCDLMGAYTKKMETDPSLGVHECIARARKLRVGDLMEAYKKQLEKAANAEQEMEEAAEDRSNAFVIFCKELLNRRYPMQLPANGSLPEEIQDQAHFQWCGQFAKEHMRAPYVALAKKSRVEYHALSLRKKLVGSPSLSISKEDVAMDAYIEKWEKGIKVRKQKIENQMKVFKKKLDDTGLVPGSDRALYVEYDRIFLENNKMVSSDGILVDSFTGYRVFLDEYERENKAKFPDEMSKRLRRLADQKWEKMRADERAPYVAMEQKGSHLPAGSPFTRPRRFICFKD